MAKRYLGVVFLSGVLVLSYMAMLHIVLAKDTEDARPAAVSPPSTSKRSFSLAGQVPLPRPIHKKKAATRR